MKDMKLAIIGCFVVVGFAGCNLAFVVQGSGVPSTEDRDIEDFDQIELSGSGTATVICGAEPALTLTIDDNLMDLISTNVSGSTLELSSQQNYSTTTGLTFDISTKTLNSLTISGSGKFDIQDCQSDSLDLRINGSGKVVVSGSAPNVNVNISGSGKIDLSQLAAKTADIKIAGSGNVTVNASEHIDVSISGSGKIQYIGNPKIDKRIAGSGKVRQIQSSHDGSQTESQLTVTDDGVESEDDASSEDDEEED